ncbi:MAG: hypothetical protein HY852_02090 [Bradyrhizobium sp.]|uniref:DUF6496 domain-containing protein n=1 Tax=Bradyrhizobium sp. TaxID=376 RepID=UPI0025BC50DD|nr:DUF6496 domain-containing protein [Bradyrhizobium sp.]MBI5260591.1 hypothetical protein [Bradyrhizobium sp.]
MARKAKKRRYSPSAGNEVGNEMRRYKKGTAKSGRGGRGGKVKSRKQAIAIGLSKARKKGKKVPPKKTSKKRATKRTTKKRTAKKRGRKS